MMAAELGQPAVRESILGEYYEMMEEESLVARIQRQSWGPDCERWERLYPIVEGFDYDPPPEKSVKGEPYKSLTDDI